jgi:hypothetical protein
MGSLEIMVILRELPLPIDIILHISSFDRVLSIRKIPKDDYRYNLLKHIPEKIFYGSIDSTGYYFVFDIFLKDDWNRFLQVSYKKNSKYIRYTYINKIKTFYFDEVSHLDYPDYDYSIESYDLY